MSNKTPENYRIEDFVTDGSFINYHFRLDTDDQAFWEKWLIAHPENSELVEEAKEMLQNLSLTLSDQEYEEQLALIRSAIKNETTHFVRSRPVIGRLLNWRNASHLFKEKRKSIKYLLPALLVFIVGGYFFLKHFRMQPDRLTKRYNESSKPVVFTLSDGTVVTLAPQGIFRYPPDFGNNDRQVYLDGEAQFQVNSDKAHPFKVYSGEVIATVLGTIFNVKEQPGDSGVVVELIKGKLKVETINGSGSSAQPIILNPNERAVYMLHGHKLYKEKWQSQDDLPLQGNHLVFRQNSFEEIAKQLKEVFGVTVVNQSNKKNWRFTGKFHNATASEIIQNICLIKNLNSQVKGDTIFLK